MDTSFQKTTASDELGTPWEIVHALGEFDLDPCSSNANHKATDFYTKEDDGLALPWHGRVWCNPPYSQPALYQFCEKMADHGNGIALIFARTGNKVWQDIIFPRATAVYFLRRRVRFCLPDGTQAGSAGCDSAFRTGRKQEAPGAILPWLHLVGTMSKPLRKAELKEN